MNLQSRPILSRVILLTLSLVSCEIFLRAIGYPNWFGSGDMPQFQQPDRELGWSNRPGKYLLQSSEMIMHIAIDEAGGRSTSHRPPADAGARVAILGDSFAYGYGLSDGETFAWKLQSAFPEARVYNYGTPRWGTSQCYLRMRKLLAEEVARPDLFIYLFNVFHETRNIGEPVWMRVNARPAAGSELNFPYYRLGQDGELVENRSPGLILPGWARASRLVVLGDELRNLVLAQSRLAEARAVTEKLMVEMHAAARAAGSELLVVPFAGSRERLREYEDLMRSRGIPFHECSTPISELERFQLPDGHPNGAMNAILAECIGWELGRILSEG